METLHKINLEKEYVGNNPKTISVFGAGLVGCLIALLMAKKGHKVNIYEKRRDLRINNGWEDGRSINLALSERGWKALEIVKIAEEIKAIAIPMRGRMIHNVNGNLSFQPYGKEGQCIYSVSRGVLNEKLMNLAEAHPNITFFFNRKCLEVVLKDAVAKLENTVSHEITHAKGDLIIGADGAFSAVRTTLQKTDMFNYSQYYIDYGYKELSIPALPNQTWAMEKNALHIWPRKNFMLIALPNLNGSFTCTLFLNWKGEDSFENLKSPENVKAFFERYFPDVLPLMPKVTEEFFQNPISSLVSIRCYPWRYEDKIALIGDAAHAMVPFYGQGMNAGFEDCTILHQLMTTYANDWLKILEEYQKERKNNTEAMTDLAMQNFIEMRDLVGDPKFLLRKKIEAYIHEKYPTQWTPLYSMVTFSHLPYAEALKIGKKQDLIMQTIMEIEDIEKVWQELDYASILKFHKAAAKN